MIPEFNGDFMQWLRGFYYVAQAGSITAATGKMGRNQPAVSHQIKMLEKEFGVPLFEGYKNRRQLTNEGKHLLKKAIALFEIIKETRDDLSYFSGTLVGKISIVTYYAVLQYYLPKFIVNFSKAFPMVDFKLEGASQEVLLNRILTGEFDFGIASIDDLPSGLEFIKLFTTKWMLITPRSGPLAFQACPSLRRISESPFIIFPHYSVSRPLILRQFAENGLSINIKLSLNHYDLIKRYVELGMGISILDDYAITEEDRERFHLHSLDHCFPIRHFGIVRRQDMYISPLLKEFFASLFNNGDLSPSAANACPDFEPGASEGRDLDNH